MQEQLNAWGNINLPNYNSNKASEKRYSAEALLSKHLGFAFMHN